jgi:hypothetical protein
VGPAELLLIGVQGRSDRVIQNAKCKMQTIHIVSHSSKW